MVSTEQAQSPSTISQGHGGGGSGSGRVVWVVQGTIVSQMSVETELYPAQGLDWLDRDTETVIVTL